MAVCSAVVGRKARFLRIGWKLSPPKTGAGSGSSRTRKGVRDRNGFSKGVDSGIGMIRISRNQLMSLSVSLWFGP